VVITLMGGGEAIGLMEWWTTYGFEEQARYNTPVTFDYSSLRGDSNVIGLPTQQLIGRGGEIINAGAYHIDESVIQGAING